MWDKGRRDSAKHGCTIDLLKFMINCRSPAICKNCLVLMRMGTRQRKKTIKYSYFESLHPAMSLALSSVSTISIIIAPAGQQPLSPGNSKAPGGSRRAAAGPAPANVLPNSSRLLQAPHRSHYCQHLLVCSWKSVLCIIADLLKPGERSKLGLTLCLGVG